MSSALEARLKPLLDQFNANPRLQFGAAFIALLLLAWVFLVLGDARDASVRKLQDGRERLAQMQQLAGQGVWVQRAQEASQLARALDAEIPAARSAGLAQADFQGWLRGIVESQGTAVRLDVQAPAMMDQPADVVKLTAVVSGPLPPQQVWQMIHRIESRPSLVTIPTALVRSNGTDHSFSLTVQGYYRLPAAAESPP